MSITLNNGVVLPDIPTAYTGEKFIASAPDPSTLKYHAIFHFSNNGDLIYYLLFSSDVPLSHISSYMMFAPMVREPLGISDNWTTHLIAEADDYSDAVWLEGACGALDDPIMPSQAFVPDWSDYDIGTITEFDPENGTVTWGTEIYFPNSLADPVPEIMSVTGEWLVSMAGHTRRLSGTADKFTPEEMDEFYSALEIPEVKEPNLMEITVTPSRTAAEAIPPEGYDGFSKINIEAAKLQNKVVTPGVKTQAVLPEGDAIGLFQVTVKAAKLEEATVTPTTEEQVFTPSGDNIGFSKFTVKAAESGGVEYPNVMEVSF